MAYDIHLASRVREYLNKLKDLQVEEKKMFGGLAFLVNDKMCINVGDNQLMCRFHPSLSEQLSRRKGFAPMVMNHKQYKGYCYVDPVGYQREEDFEFWINLCLDYNKEAKISKKRRQKPKTGS